MKTYLTTALLASVALTLCTVGTASAVPIQYETVCTSTSNSGEVPMGVRDDGNGHKWAGYKADGMPPDSLSSGGSTSTSCVQVEVQQT